MGNIRLQKTIEELNEKFNVEMYIARIYEPGKLLQQNKKFVHQKTFYSDVNV